MIQLTEYATELLQDGLPAEQRYDLGVPYQYLGLEDMSALVRLSTCWQARNARLRGLRLASEAAGPRELA